MEPLWLSLLVLHFDDETFQNFESFIHFVSSVFLFRDITLPLQSFQLKCSNASGIKPQDINRFVHAAAQRGIQNLNRYVILVCAPLESLTNKYNIINCF